MIWIIILKNGVKNIGIIFSCLASPGSKNFHSSLSIMDHELNVSNISYILYYHVKILLQNYVITNQDIKTCA